MPRIVVRLEGVPPKKGGTNSMWNQPAEQERIQALRTAVAAEMVDKPLAAREAAIRLTVRAAPRDGDLDNFLTGICDALMAASMGARSQLRQMDWSNVADDVRPGKPILIEDDAIVQRLSAERAEPVDGKREYILEVTWDEPGASIPLPPG